MNDRLKNYLVKLFISKKIKGVKILGNEISMACPFHYRNSRNSTSCFKVSMSKMEYPDYPFHCFSCHASGLLGDLLEYLESDIPYKIDTVDQIDELQSLLEKFKTKQKHRSKTFILPTRSGNTSKIHKYLRKRGIKNIHAIIKHFDLYYCRDDQRFAGRMIIPIYENEQLVYMTNRSIEDSIVPKTLHVKGMDKSHYILWFKHGGTGVMVVEGPFDLFKLVDFYYSNNKYLQEYDVCAILGSVLSDRQMLKLLDYDNVELLFDNDDAGRNGAKKAHEMLNGVVDAGILTDLLPNDKDPGSITEDQFNNIMKNRYRHCQGKTVDDVKYNLKSLMNQN